jgi:hypothetical protein
MLFKNALSAKNIQYLICQINPIFDIGPKGQKKKFQQIWKEDILINYKNAQNVIFGINYN